MAKHSVPSFFKVLSNNFTRQLKLPPYLVLKHGNILPKNVKLRTNNGITWDVKIRKTKDGDHCLTRGWSEFVTDMELVEGDYVCFYPCTYGLTLDVVVFGANCYEKKMLVFDDDGESDEDCETDPECVAHFEFVARPHFEMLLKPWQRPRLPLYKEFVEKADLMDKRKVILEYSPTKNTMPVALDNRTSISSFKFELAKGWQAFQKTNGIEVGQTYSFPFNPDRDVIQVRPVLPIM